MNKTVLIGIVILALIGLGTWLWYSQNNAAEVAGQNTNQTGGQTPTDQVQGQDVVVGTGATAEPNKIVTVEYVGALEDGTIFDSSEAQGRPLTFQLGVDPLLPGFQIGINGMKEGGERIISIPAALAYGAEGRTNPDGQQIIPANATLLFQVKLLSVEDAPETPAEGTE